LISGRLIEFLIDLERRILAAHPRQIAAVGLHGAQRGRVDLVGAFVALAGLLAPVGEIEHEAGVQVLEHAVPIRT
jgi:hypothetical protein